MSNRIFREDDFWERLLLVESVGYGCMGIFL